MLLTSPAVYSTAARWKVDLWIRGVSVHLMIINPIFAQFLFISSKTWFCANWCTFCFSQCTFPLYTNSYFGQSPTDTGFCGFSNFISIWFLRVYQHFVKLQKRGHLWYQKKCQILLGIIWWIISHLLRDPAPFPGGCVWWLCPGNFLFVPDEHFGTKVTDFLWIIL